MKLDNDEIILSLLIVGIFTCAILLLMLSGCSTYSHEPKCMCECNDTSSYFECGGNNIYKKMEVR